MNKIIYSFACIMLSTFAFSQDSGQRLVYADFEQIDKDKRPISARGGKIIFESMAQNQSLKPVIVPKILGPQSPLTQRLGFEFEIGEPNAWAEVKLKVMGLKDKGRLDDWARTLLVMAEDLSKYTHLSLEIGAAGISQVRIRLVSEGNGVDAGGFYPESYLEISNELKNYRMPLAGFKQPTGDWVKKKVTTEQVVKKLTAVEISVVKVPSKGFLVVDNIAFEK
jgi:hypothetical protein